jgi:hypothetical membrane protein
MAAIALTVFAATYLFVALFVVGARRPGYSQIRHTISELGEFGSPQQRLVAFGVFLPVGVLLALVAYLLRPYGQADAILAVCISIGYLVAAVFPCDPGSPLWGTSRQALLKLGGAIEYVGGAVALWRLGESLGQPFRAAGLIVGGTAIALSIQALAPVRGLIQRFAEFCLFGGLALSVWQNRGAV